MKTTESPKSHGRKAVKNPLAAPAPNAAANPIGRQQPIVATEPKIASKDAHIPVLGRSFTLCLVHEPCQRRGEPCPSEEHQSVANLDTSGMLRFQSSTTLPQYLVR
jgi:hypothetical protein